MVAMPASVGWTALGLLTTAVLDPQNAAVFERHNIGSPGDLREAARKLDERQYRDGHNFGHTRQQSARRRLHDITAGC